MLVPGDLAILQAIQVLLKFQKMLVGVHSLDCCASQQLHGDVSLHISLGVGHHEVNGPHVPSQQQGHDEDAPNCCPQYHRGKGGPVGVAKHLAMASGAQTGLSLQDFTCRIPFASEGPYHGNGFGILQDLGLVNDLPVLEFCVLPQLTCHGMNELVPVGLLHGHVEWHCIWITIWLGDR